MYKRALTVCLGVIVSAVSLSAAEPTTAPAPASFNGKAAATYLDGRMTWWTTWPVSARDHGTFCVSCHTVLPYAMSRPSLRHTLDEAGPSPSEVRLLEDVTKRVRMWSEVEPFYPDAQRGAPKTAESRGTESILDAMVLANYSAAAGKLSPDGELALKNMWGQQLQTGQTKGSWSWLQFHNAPFEGDSQYYGSAIAALAVGIAPGGYSATPDIQPQLDLLRQYLIRERQKQTLLDQLVLLWASTKISGLLTPAQENAIIAATLSKQQADGGFSLSNFVGGWKRHDNTPLETKSDGYATGLVSFVLQETGMPCDQPQLKRGLTWLSMNQSPTEGRWLSYSLNKQRDLSSDVGRFMSDAATAYAVMSLEKASLATR
jgi:squalene-hopene/tetraprenyl-beta-curcumene cyclase